MNTQHQLNFDPPRGETKPPAEIPISWNAPEDAPRLSNQNAAVFQRLQQGSVTNSELAQIALKYTSRISEVRTYIARWFPGWRIHRENLGGGLHSYELKKD